MTSAIVLTKPNGTTLFLSTTTRLVSVEAVTSTTEGDPLKSGAISRVRYLAAGSHTVEERDVEESPEQIIELFDAGGRVFLEELQKIVVAAIRDMNKGINGPQMGFPGGFPGEMSEESDWHPDQLALLECVPLFILEPIVDMTTADSALPSVAKLLLDEAGFLTEATVSPSSYSLKVWDPPQEESDLGRLPGADAAFMQSVLPIAGATIDRAAMRWPGTTLLRDIIVSLAGSDTVHWRLEPFDGGSDRHDPELNN